MADDWIRGNEIWLETIAESVVKDGSMFFFGANLHELGCDKRWLVLDCWKLQSLTREKDRTCRQRECI